MATPPLARVSLRSAGVAFAVSRVVILACAWAGLRVWGIDAAEAAVNWRPFSSSWPLVDVALRYDAQWYLTIARDGYGGTLDGPFFDMRPNFMPLLPLLVRAVAALGVPIAAAGLLVANLASVAGLTCLHQVVARRTTARGASTAVWVVALFPSSLFLSSVYSEAPLMAFTMGAWLAALTGRLGVAGLLAAGASLARPLGALAVLPLLAVAWHQARGSRAALVRGAVLAGAPSAAALAGYLWWAHHTWGDALMLTRTQAAYRAETTWPWMAFARWWAEGPAWHGYANSSVDAAMAIGALVAVVALARRRLWPEALLGAGAVLVPLTSGLIALSRMLLAAPVLAVALSAPADATAQPWRRAARGLWWLTTLALLAWFSARFATWRWVA